jgi:D-alanyl-D-alanine carboxypeptidase/D-alanyl-D-alanine-endopeptidase (penicillin-binding protein 4)
MVHYLHWVDGQPWVADLRRTPPVAGVDGTLRRRFKGTPLQGRLFAKTGTLLAANALAAISPPPAAGTGVSIYANDRPSGLPACCPPWTRR